MEWEITPSDRIPMIDLAVTMCQTFGAREAISEITQAEERAYIAALGLLEREFNRGYFPAQSRAIKSEDTTVDSDE